MGNRNKGLTLVLVVLFLTASLLIEPKPVFSSSTVENSWTNKASMLTQKYSFSAVSLNGKIYAIGGNTRAGTYDDHPFDPMPPENTYSGGPTGETEVYDPIFNNWTELATMKTPMTDFSVAVCQGKIYCSDSSKTMEVYDPATDLWNNNTAPKLAAREGTLMVFEDGVYIIGGNTNEVYNTTTNSWKGKTPMPYPLDVASACTLNGRFYFIGGGLNQTVNQVYDPVKDLWQVKTPTPPNTTAFESLVLDNKIYVVSGVFLRDWDIDNGYRYYRYNMSLVIYDPTTDNWTQGSFTNIISSTRPVFSYSTTGEWTPKRVYVLSDTLQAYDPQTDNWTTCSNLPTLYSNMGFAVVDERMYALGGEKYTDNWLFTYFISSTTERFSVNEQYTPFGYHTVPPSIVVNSPEALNYTTDKSITLNFTVNHPVVWMGYSLDGQKIVTVSGNTTLTKIQVGQHNITVYANDTYGNMGASETVTFTISEPFPTALVAAASGVSIAVIVVSLLVYFKKRKH
jgi:N-acetylneuraminic acid mutarotase